MSKVNSYYGPKSYWEVLEVVSETGVVLQVTFIITHFKMMISFTFVWKKSTQVKKLNFKLLVFFFFFSFQDENIMNSMQLFENVI